MNTEIKAATHIVHWPGKDVPACGEHMAQLLNLGRVMGFALSCTPSDDQPCTNCENAQKARGGQ